ncbi:C-type lectin domain family 4 member K isoform X2 [Coregonus clupeaformis]|uniref:C-type lectin domain-containing protein n=1 Tax=Coregonus suidteri TaxID=861788 RepID=A0AAN8LN38_9TELE|nr:C-type lectin domain family 4 member K isoform X2 [Coregonus clupeaformis]
MENSDISENVLKGFKGTYNELICQDDFSTDGHPLYNRQDQQQVSMFMVRDGLSSRFYRLVAVSLGMLSALLLAVDIGLGVQYSKVSEKYSPLYQNLTQISSELEQLRATHRNMIHAKEEALTVLQRELQNVYKTSGQLESAKHTGMELQRQVESLQEQKVALQSRVTEVVESCGRCLPGWELLNSVCYYFPLSDSIPLKTWDRSRDNCIKQGADLAKIDSEEKQEFINKAIQALRYSSGSWHLTGFWIGLKEEEDTEGTWTWLDGTELTQGYWADGEPNDAMNNEDCAAIYSKKHPTWTSDRMKTWNDAPCRNALKWICEMKAKAAQELKL